MIEREKVIEVQVNYSKINEFMGYPTDELHDYMEWGELMRVIQKIESMFFNVDICSWETKIHTLASINNEFIACCESKLPSIVTSSFTMEEVEFYSVFQFPESPKSKRRAVLNSIAVFLINVERFGEKLTFFKSEYGIVTILPVPE